MPCLRSSSRSWTGFQAFRLSIEVFSGHAAEAQHEIVAPKGGITEKHPTAINNGAFACNSRATERERMTGRPLPPLLAPNPPKVIRGFPVSLRGWDTSAFSPTSMRCNHKSSSARACLTNSIGNTPPTTSPQKVDTSTSPSICGMFGVGPPMAQWRNRSTTTSSPSSTPEAR